MLIRISLIVAIVAGLAVGALNFVKVKEIITTTRAERDEWHGKFDKTDAELRTTKKDLDKTTAELKTTQESLATATAEKDKAVATATSLSKRAAQLQEELTTAKTTLGEAQAELEAYHQSGLTPAQVLALNRTLKLAQDSLTGSQEENRILGRKNDSLRRELARYTGGLEPIQLPATLKGQVVVSDPKWDFVVLNIGENQQVVPDAELLVNRNGRLVAKVKVTSVQKDRCVANVVPGWKLGELLEGDLVIPAYPQS
jgi:hypothetical protein